MRFKPFTVVAAAVLVPTFRAAVRFRGFNRAADLAVHLGRRRRRLTASGCDEIVATVDAVTRHLPIDGKCLARSLALWTLLRRRGLAPELRLGVALDQPERAHAWVVLDGHVLGERVETLDTAEFPLAGVLAPELVGV
jgi:hypothetical protein